VPVIRFARMNQCSVAAEEAARVALACGVLRGGPNAQVQGRALGVAEARSGGGVPCNAQLGRGAVGFAEIGAIQCNELCRIDFTG
jgi:hypothetical protein